MKSERQSFGDSTRFTALHHFTNEIWLPPILVEGIRVPRNTTEIEPNLAPEGLGVWLTDEPDASKQKWKFGSVLDKAAVRLTIEVPDEFHRNLRRWRELASELGVSKDWYRALDTSGGYGARHWWVCRTAVRPAWIREVTVNGRVVDPTNLAPLWVRRRELMHGLVERFGTLPADLIPTEDERQEFSGEPLIEILRERDET